MPKRKQATTVQMLAIAKLLEEHGVVEESTTPPTYTYNDGWDDIRIATLFQLDRSTVGRIRREAFGHTHIQRSKTHNPGVKASDSPSEMLAKIQQLQIAVNKLRSEARLALRQHQEIVGRIDYLYKELGL